jgi:hypothetical protein
MPGTAKDPAGRTAIRPFTTPTVADAELDELGVWVFSQAGSHRMGSGTRRAGLGRADEPPRLPALRSAGRRLGRGRRERHGPAGSSGVARHSR